MRLDVRAKADAEFLDRVEHEFAVASKHCGVENDGRCLYIFELAADVLMLESCFRGAWVEGRGVEDWVASFWR